MGYSSRVVAAETRSNCSKEGKSPMKVERVNSGNLAINSMPDGSRIIRNSDDNTVLALNPTAAAAWEACASATTTFAPTGTPKEGGLFTIR